MELGSTSINGKHWVRVLAACVSCLYRLMLVEAALLMLVPLTVLYRRPTNLEQGM